MNKKPKPPKTRIEEQRHARAGELAVKLLSEFKFIDGDITHRRWRWPNEFESRLAEIMKLVGIREK